MRLRVVIALGHPPSFTAKQQSLTATDDFQQNRFNMPQSYYIVRTYPSYWLVSPTFADLKDNLFNQTKLIRLSHRTAARDINLTRI